MHTHPRSHLRPTCCDRYFVGELSFDVAFLTHRRRDDRVAFVFLVVRAMIGCLELKGFVVFGLRKGLEGLSLSPL